MKKVLVAGATGYLGKYVVQEFKKQGYWVRALARNKEKLDELKNNIDEMFEAEATKPETLTGICENIDVVISSIGITRQKDGLTYMDVDYQVNADLLKEAKRNGVKKFIYVSVLNGQFHRKLKMIQAKEYFVDELKSSGINYIVIRPNGFFSDMTEVLTMAKKGKVYLFGDGGYKSNPIHGADLAEVIVANINSNEQEIEIGGPELLTQNRIAQAAFAALGKKEKIVYIPVWIKNVSLKLVRWFSSQRTYGPIEFFLTVMTMDMIAPQFGNHRLSDYYAQLIKSG